MRYPISRCFSTAPGRHRTVWKNRTIPYCVNYKHASKLKTPEFDSATARNKNKRSWSKRTHCRRHPRRHLGARVSSLSATTPPSGMETHVCKQNSGGLCYLQVTLRNLDMQLVRYSTHFSNRWRLGEIDVHLFAGRYGRNAPVTHQWVVYYFCLWIDFSQIVSFFTVRPEWLADAEVRRNFHAWGALSQDLPQLAKVY